MAHFSVAASVMRVKQALRCHSYFPHVRESINRSWAYFPHVRESLNRSWAYFPHVRESPDGINEPLAVNERNGFQEQQQGRLNGFA